MRAIILAAGRGSRMGDLTDEQPKCLTQVYGKQLIEHQIDAIHNAGIHQIGIVTGYKAECLQSYGNYHFHNAEWLYTNMVYSLFCAREWLEQDECIISYGDIFYSSDIVRKLMQCDQEIVVAYDPDWLELWSKRFKNPLDDAETFKIDDEGYLTEIGDKPKTIEEVQGQYMGLLKFAPNFWNNDHFNVPKKMDMTTYLSNLLKHNYPIKGVANEGMWGEIDSQDDLKVYKK